MATIRQAKVGEMIKRELAEILQKEMRDPRLALVSVTGVDVARDFSIAKVFISVVGGTDEEKRLAIKGLQNAAGYLRGHLGRAMSLRTIPMLAFRLDTGVDRGIRMFELLREEAQQVAQNHLDTAKRESDDDRPADLPEIDFAVSSDAEKA